MMLQRQRNGRNILTDNPADCVGGLMTAAKIKEIQASILLNKSRSDEMGPVLLIVFLPCLQDSKSTFAESAMRMAEKTERRD